MSITDKIGPDLDPKNRSVTVLFNADKIPKTIAVPELAGMSLDLHTVLQHSTADLIVRQSRYETATGTFTIPARTAAVFVERQ
jgi:hypothetical protein